MSDKDKVSNVTKDAFGKGILLPYQKKWILDKSRFKVGKWSRQVGKTFATTLEIVDEAIGEEAVNRRSDWIWLSKSENQAKEAIETGVKRHLQAYKIAFDSYDYDFDPKTKAHEVVLPGGSLITAISANPDAARGFSRNIVLDEFAFHKDPAAIWKGAFPIVTRGYKIRVISTPNGKGNKFYELMTVEDNEWSKHIVDIYRAVREGYDIDINELRRALNDEDTWAQEYELEWLDEASSWISYELINGVEHELAGVEKHYQGNPVYIGNDIGRRNDLWVAWVIEPVGDVYWTREVVTLKRKSFAHQDAVMDKLFDKYKVARLCMDQTGMGEKPVEDAQRRYGESRVEGVLFTPPNKLVLATLGKQAFEDKTIRIPMGDKALRDDLHKLKKETSATGAPRFVAESDNKGHADRAWALFLALNAAQRPAVKIDYASAGRRLVDSVGSMFSRMAGF